MKISHSAIKSSIFELVKIVELDLQLGDDAWSVRIEVFQNTEAKDRFRCHIWELESFRLTPTFPQKDDGQPADISDDVLLVDRGIAHSRIAYPREDIVASDVETALEIVLEDLRRFLVHVTGEKAR